MSDRVVFAGERHDVAAMLSAIDLFVASSNQETFGLSVLEALANGPPVPYTTCPALDGLDVDRARQVPSTVAGLREAMAAERQSGPRQRVSVPAIREAYGIDAVTRRIDDFYERLAASRSRVGAAAGRRARRPRGSHDTVAAAPQPAREGAPP